MQVYNKVLKFKLKYKFNVGFRLKQHSSVIEKHLNPGETINYAFFGQKNKNNISLFNTYVIALTNKRILLGRKRLVFGYFFYGITPDLFNDLKVKCNLFWGQVIIDTIKEVVKISNISKKALCEIETEITEYMMEKKKEITEKDN